MEIWLKTDFDDNLCHPFMSMNTAALPVVTTADTRRTSNRTHATSSVIALSVDWYYSLTYCQVFTYYCTSRLDHHIPSFMTRERCASIPKGLSVLSLDAELPPLIVSDVLL